MCSFFASFFLTRKKEEAYFKLSLKYAVVVRKEVRARVCIRVCASGAFWLGFGLFP